MFNVVIRNNNANEKMRLNTMSTTSVLYCGSKKRNAFCGSWVDKVGGVVVIVRTQW